MQTKNLNFNKKIAPQAGFSLVELLVAMLISLILIFACTTLYSSLKSSISTAQDLAKAQESLRGAFYLMSRSIRQAGSLTISGAGNTELLAEYGEVTDDPKLYSCLGNQLISGSTPTDTYSSNGDGLYCDDGIGIDEQLIALGVETLTFTAISHADSTGATIYDGVKVTMKIDGMPESMKTAGGLMFTLALRQKILLDLAD
ncbi:PilW family protein [Psychromonas sp.]|uniref:PilW family protein n=1 Tax=Psychromonas sp. TaxID=1884585 RepID=UPI0039E605E2